MSEIEKGIPIPKDGRGGAKRSGGYVVRVENVFVRSADDVLGVYSVATHLREWVFGLRVRRDYCAR